MNIDILVSEVGPRDGLQSIKHVVPTETKKQWIAAMAKAGLAEIEVGSFVPASLLPQLADTAEVVAFSKDIVGLTSVVLAPNLHGVKAAVKAGARSISIPFSMSEAHSIANLNMDHPKMLAEIGRCVDYINSLDQQDRPELSVGLSTAFGCSIAGHVSEASVLALAEQVVELGVKEIGLSDTTGSGNPKQLERLVQGIRSHCGHECLNSVHLHNTRGQGLANALKAVELGITTIDSSLGGIGGCPWAPGASGNIVTEDLVFLLESMGLRTGIDLDALAKARELIQQALPEEPLYGFTPAAGTPMGWPFPSH